MSVRYADSLTIFERRRARRLAHWNAAVWAVGNGLVGGMLVTYMLQEMASTATGLERSQIGLLIGLVFAAPHLAGLLRIAVPHLLPLWGTRRRFCATFYLASAMILTALPAAPLMRGRLSDRAVLWSVPLIWCLYHLTEYLATVSLWSWLRDLVPTRIRGRFIGRRQRWMLVGQSVAMLTAGLHTWGWLGLHPQGERWIPYSICAATGTLFLAASIVPLLRMPDLPFRTSKERTSLRTKWNATIRPLRDKRFVGLLLFGCWFSFANGSTQSVQGRYPYILGIGLFTMLAFKTSMRFGQIAISPRVGRFADRCGNRRLIAWSIPLIATGPLFYLAAGACEKDLTIRLAAAGAWIVWIAWVGFNIGLQNLLLKLSPKQSEGAAYIATFYAVTGMFYALAALGGGALSDRFAQARWTTPPLGNLPTFTFDSFQFGLFAGWALRLFSLVMLFLFVREASEARRSN